jgi:hypothetical protein
MTTNAPRRARRRGFFCANRGRIAGRFLGRSNDASVKGEEEEEEEETFGHSGFSDRAMRIRDSKRFISRGEQARTDRGPLEEFARGIRFGDSLSLSLSHREL